ncbi:MAG: ABC transporter permease [Desulfitobacteriaceae bacterium]|nr:ABC transporter permease [Desulfitobacteriaceae bacterium]
MQKLWQQIRWFRIRFWFSAQMALHGILAKPLRSILTILGVSIGVASVVSLMGIGEGARLAVVKQFQSLGTNVIVVKAMDPAFEFQPKEAEELKERVSALNMATPVVHADVVMKWRRSRGNAEIIGVNQDFSQIRDHQITAGHFFTRLHVEQRSPVAVLGYNVANSLLGGRSPVGMTCALNGLDFRIVGVLDAKGQGKADGIDDKILVPYTTAQKLAEKRTVEEIWGKAESADEADLAVVQLGRIFRRELGLDQSAPTIVPAEQQGKEGTIGERGMVVERGMDMGQPPPEPLLSQGQDAITITSLNQMVEEADKANRIMTLLLGGIAAVSLLVGGLGIMNIMLVAVSERTSEIGVRRALGAKQGDLVTQFLLEAFYLSGIGALAGIIGGIWGLEIFGRYGFETAISFTAVKIASLVALGSGLLFGVYPAVQASSVPPVEALRR